MIDVTGGGVQAGWNSMLMGIQHQVNRNLAKEEREWQEKMWHEQNLYNSPAQQMQRFREAGLNPNLIFGQGTPGNATELPHYQRANVHTSGVGQANSVGMMQLLQEKPLIQAQTAKTQSETELNKLYQISEQLHQINKQIENERDSTNLEILKRTKETLIMQQEQTLLNLKAQGDNTAAHTGLLNLQQKTEEGKPGLQKSEGVLNYARASESVQNARQSREYIKNLRQDREYKYFQTQWQQLDNTEKMQMILYFLPENIREQVANADKATADAYWKFVGTAKNPTELLFNFLNRAVTGEYRRSPRSAYK